MGKLKLHSKSGTCQNCGEEEQELYKVRRKDKVVGWCSACLDGYYLTKNYDPYPRNN